MYDLLLIYIISIFICIFMFTTYFVMKNLLKKHNNPNMVKYESLLNSILPKHISPYQDIPNKVESEIHNKVNIIQNIIEPPKQTLLGLMNGRDIYISVEEEEEPLDNIWISVTPNKNN